MRQTRLWAYLPAFCLLALPVLGQSELKLGSDAAARGANADVPLTLSTSAQVQGVVAAFDWASGGTGVDLVAGAAIADADVVERRVEGNYMVLGVVMDITQPIDKFLGPGSDIGLATAVIQCGQTDGSFDVVFRDDAYATVDGGPLLDNIVVVGGLSVGETEGLTLTDGSFDCLPCVDRFFIAQPPDANPFDNCCQANVMLANCAPVEGYVVALCHDSALSLKSVEVGSAAVAQDFDFSASEISSAGATLGVVIDLTAPFTDNTIPVGAMNQIAMFDYEFPADGTYGLSFCDNVLGSPVKENIVVQAGQSISPTLEDGSITCTQEPVPPAEQAFSCGSRAGAGTTVEAPAASETEICFYVQSPEDDASGHAQFDHIQGFSMAVTYCCELSAREEFDTSGTIVEAIGAEFVSIQVDNDPNDGDGCELVIGVLVDALPPFDGQTIPPLPDFQRVGCVTFDVAADAECGKICSVQFTDGINGRGKVPIKNLISVENESRNPQLNNCEVEIVGQEVFHRGDCNYSSMGNMSVDIADAAAVVSFLFLPGTWKFNPPCLDACDCNDDGRIDLADSVCILQYLFLGGRTPPAPGPGFNPDTGSDLPAGPDPTDDKLDCEAGRSCE